jgi:hypothetical protein
MYAHLIYFTYFYKNDPQTEIEDVLLCPYPTSTEARVYFWYNVGSIQEIDMSELDSVRIVQVQSTYIKT